MEDDFIATNHFYIRVWKPVLVRVSNLDYENGWQDLGDFHPVGIIALGVKKSSPNWAFASGAVCSTKDQFTKKLARHIAYERLSKTCFCISREDSKSLNLKLILGTIGKRGSENALFRHLKNGRYLDSRTEHILEIQVERLFKEADKINAN